MKKIPVPVVPAGKRPVLKKTARKKPLLQIINQWLRANKVLKVHFIAAAAIILVATVTLVDYMSNYVYVVIMGDREVGIVEDAGEVEVFVADLTERLGELYGMRMEPGEKIALVKEFRPDCNPEPETVQTAIRHGMSMLTDAYMINVNGQPFVPVRSEKELSVLINSLKAAYSSRHSSVSTIDSSIMDDLDLEPCKVDPDSVYSADEIVALLTGTGEAGAFQAAAPPGNSERSSVDSRHSPGYHEASLLFPVNPAAEFDGRTENPEGNLIRVKTVEEVKIMEPIPFSTEVVYDDEMWLVDSEIDVPGEEGMKEIVYRVIRENNFEVERAVISRETVVEPVTQVERHGTAKVPSVGTGRFTWPVDGGEVTPGRGFSSYHTGIDIHAEAGTDIFAADSGIVWFSGRGGSQGNYMIIYHGSYWTLYLHNQVNLVSEGTQVEKGQVIGKVGSTGRSSGPHLHFEIRLDDGTGEWHGYYQHKPIDPLRFFNP